MPLVDEATDTLDDEARLIDLVEGFIATDRLAGTVLSPEVLAQPCGIVGDQRIGRFQDVAGGAIVLLQPDGARRRIIGLERLDVLDLGPAPAVDGLIVVADGEQMVVATREQTQPGVLDGIGVLELIDQDMREASLVVMQDVRPIAQYLQRAQQQIGEVERAATDPRGFVFAIDRDHLVLREVAGLGQVMRTQSLILLAIDEALDLARRPARFVDLQFLEQALDESKLIVGVEDLELLGQTRILPVCAQKAMRQTMEGTDPHAADRSAEHLVESTAHLACGLVGEGDGQDRPGLNLLDLEQPGNAVNEHARLARSRTGEDQQMTGIGRDGFALRRVEWVEQMRNVHRAILNG
jgi:hypothetical protein